MSFSVLEVLSVSVQLRLFVFPDTAETLGVSPLASIALFDDPLLDALGTVVPTIFDFSALSPLRAPVSSPLNDPVLGTYSTTPALPSLSFDFLPRYSALAGAVPPLVAARLSPLSADTLPVDSDPPTPQWRLLGTDSPKLLTSPVPVISS